MRKKIIALLLTAGLLAGTAAPAFAAALEVPGRILLSWTGDTETTQTISWQDAPGQTEGYVRWGRAEDFSDGTETAAQYTEYESGLSNGGSRFEATLTGLAPETAYYYQVGGPGRWSSTRRFTTGGGAGPCSFLYMGDVQVARSAEEEFAAWGARLEELARLHPELAFAMLGGDIVESGISAGQWDSFLDAASPVCSGIPLMPTNGNHESNFAGSGKPELYLDVFSLPENGPAGFEEECYSFDYADCHVLVLNSWIYSGEQGLDQEDYDAVNDWIADDLARSTADWQIVVTHVPVYAVHSDRTATELRENWAPIFERYGVDMVFEGHQHVYSRSYPLYEGRVDYENGITYIMGVSGAKFYDSADETLAERTIYNTAVYQLVQVNAASLTVRTLDGEGNELDYCAAVRREVSVSRGEYLETLWRGAGRPDAGDAAVFTDVPGGTELARAAAWAVRRGLVLGYGDGRFGPEDSVTREQIALIQSRATAR